MKLVKEIQHYIMIQTYVRRYVRTNLCMVILHQLCTQTFSIICTLLTFISSVGHYRACPLPNAPPIDSCHWNPVSGCMCHVSEHDSLSSWHCFHQFVPESSFAEHQVVVQHPTNIVRLLPLQTDWRTGHLNDSQEHRRWGLCSNSHKIERERSTLESQRVAAANNTNAVLLGAMIRTSFSRACAYGGNCPRTQSVHRLHRHIIHWKRLQVFDSDTEPSSKEWMPVRCVQDKVGYWAARVKGRVPG